MLLSKEIYVEIHLSLFSFCEFILQNLRDINKLIKNYGKFK